MRSTFIDSLRFVSALKYKELRLVDLGVHQGRRVIHHAMSMLFLNDGCGGGLSTHQWRQAGVLLAVCHGRVDLVFGDQFWCAFHPKQRL